MFSSLLQLLIADPDFSQNFFAYQQPNYPGKVTDKSYDVAWARVLEYRNYEPVRKDFVMAQYFKHYAVLKYFCNKSPDNISSDLVHEAICSGNTEAIKCYGTENSIIYNYKFTNLNQVKAIYDAGYAGHIPTSICSKPEMLAYITKIKPEHYIECIAYAAIYDFDGEFLKHANIPCYEGYTTLKAILDSKLDDINEVTKEFILMGISLKILFEYNSIECVKDASPIRVLRALATYSTFKDLIEAVLHDIL